MQKLVCYVLCEEVNYPLLQYKDPVILGVLNPCTVISVSWGHIWMMPRLYKGSTGSCKKVEGSDVCKI